MDNKKNGKAILLLKHPESGKAFLIAENDLDAPMDWQEANEISEQLNSDWRLPTIDELETMHQQLHLSGKENFVGSHYWSGTAFSEDAAWYINFETGEVSTATKLLGANVRFVCNSNSTTNK